MRIPTVAAAFLILFISNATAQPGGGSSQGEFDTYSFNMSPYNGQTVRIVAQAASCEGSPVGFFIDNVRLSSGGSILNGSFESGLDDWVVDDPDCVIYPAEAGDGIGFEGDNTAPTPTDGTFLAASSASAPGLCRLSQDVAISGSGTLRADMGWTFTQFSIDNIGCEVSLRLENLGGGVLESAIVFRPEPHEVPMTPLWSLLALSGLLALLGRRRLRRDTR